MVERLALLGGGDAGVAGFDLRQQIANQRAPIERCRRGFVEQVAQGRLDAIPASFADGTVQLPRKARLVRRGARQTAGQGLQRALGEGFRRRGAGDLVI